MFIISTVKNVNVKIMDINVHYFHSEECEC